jgi:hypothetical protein
MQNRMLGRREASCVFDAIARTGNREQAAPVTAQPIVFRKSRLVFGLVVIAISFLLWAAYCQVERPAHDTSASVPHL